MEKDFIRSIFGLDEAEYDKVCENLQKSLYRLLDIGDDGKEEAKKETENKNEDNEQKSYVRMKGSRYEDGKLVKKYDKEYVDGECTKDVEYNAEKSIGNNEKNDSVKKCDNKKKYASSVQCLSSLQKKCDEYKSQIDEMCQLIDGLRDKIKALEFENTDIKKENEELREKINNIKKCF